ncbi:MAG: amidohydrolase [Planctomycetes bacterium]|nr:amidohydrolase [Planctomycetota bacterium]
MSNIRQMIASELTGLRAIRHDLHRHPELSFQEKRTSGVVQRELGAMGVKFKAGLGGGTGVLGYLPATDPANASRKAVGLRADMDALPIVEQTGKPYASQSSGVMHACGHDGHTTILLGAARILSKLPRPRPVAFVFQPAEEGGGGADVMCKEGALAGDAGGGFGQPVEIMFGLHGWPTVEVGHVATKPGPLLAATDDFNVTIKGVQSHGAYPHYGSDPILATAHVITALQSIASRNVSPLDSVVCTVGAVHAGTANNIIPQEVQFIGTIRTLRAETRTLAKRRFFEVVESAARSLGCSAHIDWHEGYPVTHNDPDATERFFSVARAALGGDRVDRTEHATMGGEDFSYYGQRVPACFFFLGLKPRNADSCPTLHQPDFDFNDDALPVGIELMCRLATTE